MDARELRLRGVCSVATMDFMKVYHTKEILKTADEIVLTIALHKGKYFAMTTHHHTQQQQQRTQINNES